ncbi:MAG: DUF58 domain-containing protein [Anaerolineae bacterium]|nr:DUF58 domain-containing protein [Anaerolineae bacterium]
MFNAFRSLLRRETVETPALFDEAFLRRLERLALQPDRTLRGGIMGAHRSRRRAPGPYMVDHRPYASGDDLRYVDWHAYARSDHLFVKLTEAAQDVTVHVVVDHSGSMRWGAPPKLFATLRLAAAIGYIALANGDRVTVTPFASRVDEAFGPVQSKLQAASLRRFLEDIQPSASPANGSAAAEAVQQVTQSRRGGRLVLISDLLADDWVQALVLHLLDPLELAPALEDDLDLEDVETGERVPVAVTGATLDLYRSRVERWCADTEAACGRLGATYARVQTDWPIERVAIPYLRRRRMLV